MPNHSTWAMLDALIEAQDRFSLGLGNGPRRAAALTLGPPGAADLLRVLKVCRAGRDDLVPGSPLMGPDLKAFRQAADALEGDVGAQWVRGQVRVTREGVSVEVQADGRVALSVPGVRVWLDEVPQLEAEGPVHPRFVRALGQLLARRYDAGTLALFFTGVPVMPSSSQ